MGRGWGWGVGVRLNDAREGMTRGWNGAGDLLGDVGEILRSLIWHPFALLLPQTRTDEVPEVTVRSKPEKHLNHGSLNRGPQSAATHVNYIYVKSKDRKRSLGGKKKTTTRSGIRETATTRNVVLWLFFNNHNAFWHYRNSHNAKCRVVAVFQQPQRVLALEKQTQREMSCCSCFSTTTMRSGIRETATTRNVVL